MQPLPIHGQKFPEIVPCPSHLAKGWNGKSLGNMGSFPFLGTYHHLQSLGKFPTFSTNLVSHFFVHHYPNFFTISGDISPPPFIALDADGGSTMTCYPRDLPKTIPS
jgi:hypothetical protein